MKFYETNKIKSRFLKMKRIKTVLLSIGYLITIIVLIGLTDYLLGLFYYHVLSGILNWFNGLSLFLKIILACLVGIGVLMSITYFFSFVSTAFNAFIFYFFPYNKFTLVSSVILVVLNILLGVKVLWDSIPGLTFWTVIEFIILAGLVISINAIFIERHKMKEG